MSVYFKSKYILSYIWLLCIVIYIARSLIGYGTIITVFAQLFVDIIGIYSLFYLSVNISQRLLKKAAVSLFILFSFMLLYYVLYPKSAKGGAWLEDGGSALNQVKLFIFSISGFAASAYFTMKRRLDIKILRIFFVVLWITSILVFFYNQSFIIEKYGSSIVVNNSGYTILSLLALSFILGKNLRIIYLISAVLISCLSAKRGAALQGILFSVLVFFLSMRGESYKQKLSWIMLACIASVIVLLYFSDSFDPILNRLQRDSTNSSTRQDIIKSIFISFFNGNPFFMIFGYGSLSSVIFSGNYAHNDFVEVMCDYGFFGLSLLLSFYYFLFRYYCSVKGKDNLCSNILLISLLSCIYKSCLSMNLYAVEGCIPLLSAGFAMAYIKSEKY